MIPLGKRLRAKWEAGEPAFGLWAGIPTSVTPELGGLAGYDFVCADLQHGLATEATLLTMFQGARGAGAVPMARLAWNEPWLVMRALDIGAAGVILPLIDNAAEAARAVEACRYPPIGRRSYGPIRAEMIAGATDPETVGADALCFAMIETRDGLDNLDEIAATPGLDGLYIGPSDLSLALGLRPGGLVDDPAKDRKPLADAIERIRQACEANGLIPGIHCSAGRAAALHAQLGFRLITVGVDAGMLKGALAHELKTARGA